MAEVVGLILLQPLLLALIFRQQPHQNGYSTSRSPVPLLCLQLLATLPSALAIDPRVASVGVAPHQQGDRSGQGQIQEVDSNATPPPTPGENLHLKGSYARVGEAKDAEGVIQQVRDFSKFIKNLVSHLFRKM